MRRQIGFHTLSHEVLVCLGEKSAIAHDLIVFFLPLTQQILLLPGRIFVQCFEHGFAAHAPHRPPPFAEIDRGLADLGFEGVVALHGFLWAVSE